MDVSTWAKPPTKCRFKPIIITARLLIIQQEAERNTMELNLESWCQRLLDLSFDVKPPNPP